MAEDGRARREKEALQGFGAHPEYFPEHIRKAILSNRVIIGMPPYDVYLAAGAFSFKGNADPKWPNGFDPWKVMWAQTQQPGQSEIWLTFESDTQLPEQNGQHLRAHVQNGKEKTFEHLDAAP